jgi:hypothetical protein
MGSGVWLLPNLAPNSVALGAGLYRLKSPANTGNPGLHRAFAARRVKRALSH